MRFDGRLDGSVGEADEALDAFGLRHDPAERGEDLHVGADGDALAVDEHAVAVEDHELEGAAHAPAARLRQGDEGVADGAQIFLDLGTGAAVVRAGGGILAAAPIEDDVDVVGLGEGLAEIPEEVGAIARNHEDLATHGARL
jgi:hypothetical protein